jgi:hypothetical protein
MQALVEAIQSYAGVLVYLSNVYAQFAGYKMRGPKFIAVYQIYTAQASFR